MNASGGWSYTTGILANGAHVFTATTTDAAGNSSAASNAVDPTIGVFTGVQAGTLTVANGTILDITGTANNTFSQGRNPAAAKREAKEKQRLDALRVTDTLYSVAENFLALEGGKLRSVDERRRTFQRLIYPVLGVRPISEIRRSEIVKLLDAIEHKNGASMAHQTLAYLWRVMSWYASRSDNFASPCVRGMRRIDSKARARSRILSDAEIRKVWQAADATEGAFGRFVQFLLLTGARRTEAAGLRFDEITGADWRLPAARNKTKVDLNRPLSAAAMKIIAETPKTSDRFVFCVDGVHPLSGFARPKAKLDVQSGSCTICAAPRDRCWREQACRAKMPSDA